MYGSTPQGQDSGGFHRDARGQGHEAGSTEEPPARSRDTIPAAELDQRTLQLMRTIESEIIPRLMLAHRAVLGCPTVARPADTPPGPERIAEFARLILDNAVTVAACCADAQGNEEMTLEGVYVDLLAPTARHLGDLWTADECDFTAVSIGLWRLQQVVHQLSEGCLPDATVSSSGRRVLLAPAPGDQHTLGIAMLSEIFRRAGWDVWGYPPVSVGELIETVRCERFDVVGLSAGCGCRADEIAQVIGEIRAASCNRDLVVLVGGALFLQAPDMASRVGADATAADAREATDLADRLVGSRVGLSLRFGSV